MSTVIIDVKLGSEDAAKKAKELAASIKEIKNEQKELKKSGDENSAAYVQNAQQLRTLQAEQKSYIQLSQSEIGSNNQLRAQLALLTQQYNALSKEERDNTLIGEALTKQMKSLSDELKGNEEAVGDNRRSVGDYAKGVASLNPQLSAAVTGFSDMKGQLNSLGSVLKNTETGLFSIRKALLATGIGAIIVLVSSLLSYLTKYQPVLDAINKYTSALSAAFDTLGKNVFNLATNFKKLFTDPIGAVKDLANGVGNLGKEMANAAAQAAKLSEAQSKLDRDNINNIARSKELIRQEEALKNIRDNEFNSISERIKANEQASAIEKKRLQEQEALLVRQLNILKQQANIKGGINKISNEELKAIREVELSIADIREESIGRENEFLTNRFQLQKEANDKQKELNEKRKADQKELEDALLESERRILDLTLDARQKELVDINRDIDDKIKQYQRFGKATEQLERERVARLKKAQEDFQKEDLQKLIVFQDKLKTELEKATDAQISAIYNEDKRKAEAKKVANERELQSLDERIKASALLVLKGNTDELLIMEQLQNQKKAVIQRQTNEDIKLRTEEELRKNVALAQLAFDTAQTPEQELAARQEFLIAKTAMDIEAAQGNADLIAEINARAENEQEAIDNAVINNKIARFQEFSTQFQAITGKNTLAAKIAADISARIDAAQQLRNNVLIIQEQVKAIVSQGKLVFPLNISAIFSTLSALAAGISSAKTLFKAPQAFATGGVFESDGNGTILSGPGTGTSDSINARLSNGEAIINARSTAKYKGLLSAINVAEGGKPLAPGFAMATGGLASGSFVSSLGDDAQSSADITNAIILGMQLAPAPIVDVRDVVSETQKMDRVIVNATI